MRRVVITVVGSRRRVNVAVPLESPIRELVGTLAQRCGEKTTAGNGTEPPSWVLATSRARELPGEHSLEDCGVKDGAVVYLRAASGVDDPSGCASGRAAQPRTVLPEPVRTVRRLGRAALAMLPGRPAVWPPMRDGTAPAPDASVARLSVHPRASPLTRARRSWSSTSYLSRLDAAIMAPRLQRCLTVAVMSPKGGVGKTTVAALVGTLLAALRRDRVVAVDTNPDHGSLGRSLTPAHTTYVDDLLYLFQTPTIAATTLDAALGRGPHGLMVLPAPTDPARMARLDEEAYTRVIHRLQEMVGVVVLDCGTGLQEPAALAALKCTDALLLVTDAEPATASIVAEAAHLLARANRPMVVVVNKMPSRRTRLNLAALVERLSAAQGVVLIPHDEGAASRLATGELDWRETPYGWKVAVRELAAVLLSDYALHDTAPAIPMARHPIGRG